MPRSASLAPVAATGDAGQAPDAIAPGDLSVAHARPRMSHVIARLTGANVLGAAAGFITGPLLARALGASGRGDLAAIIVPLALAPYVLGLGIHTYAIREVPRGRPVNEVIGSLGVPLLVLGAIGGVCAIPLANLLAEGRETVRTFLTIGFFAMPASLLGLLTYSVLAGLERWRRLIAMRLIPIGVSLVAIVVLYALGRLTVATAAAFAIAGTVLSLAPALILLTKYGRPVFHRSLATNGLGFGVKTWFGSLALLANARLDQLLMITVVAPRELGLYVVAVTLSGASSLLTTAVTPPLITRIAGGETYLLPQALRISLATTVMMNLGLAAVTPFLLPALFGPDFRDAVPMTIVLLCASVSFAGASVLSSALQADGAPVAPSIAEGIAIVITVLGLAVLLGPLGGLGAAIVSFVSYSASFGYQLVVARRRIHAPLRAYLLPSAADLAWARRLL